MKLGSIIRKQRTSDGISLTKMAQRLRISKSHLSRIERNRETALSRRLLVRISRALRVEMDSIFIAAGRVPDDVAQWIVSTPGALEQLRKQMRS